MSPATFPGRTPVLRGALLVLILAGAVVARLWAIGAGVPFAVGIDEPAVVDRALRILHTGDWNTHLFDYPTLVIYLHAVVAIVRFLIGAVMGEWASLDAFSITSVYMSGRVVAAAIGVATVWLTYALGAEMSSPMVGLLAAAELAVDPSHVRESHFILTDVPTTALTTAAVWLAVRAGQTRTSRAYGWAGALCGLAAAAKYTGGVALVAVATAWLIHERSAPDRWRKAAAALGATALAFLIAAPYTVLDLPGFLDGFAHQFARFTVPHAGDPPWMLYIKHLSLLASWRLPLAGVGVVFALWRSGARAKWAPAIAFGFAYFYVLGTHRPVFARYALPLLPILSLLTAVAVIELLVLARRIPLVADARAFVLLATGVVVLLLFPAVHMTVNWLGDEKHPDTRAIAAAWLETSAPGARVAVENSGPTYLESAHLQVVATELLLDHPADWYRTRADYLIVSATDRSRYGEYLAAGSPVFEIAPTPQRWGPPITVIKLQ